MLMSFRGKPRKSMPQEVLDAALEEPTLLGD